MEQSADELRKHILDQLSWDSRIDSKSIRVEVENGDVVISGTVFSNMEKKAAENDLWILPGVKKVANHLKVVTPEGIPKPPDDEIKWNIKTVLALHSSIDSKGIEIVVNNGIVLLSGSVDDFWEKSSIEDVILEVPGVYEILNALTVVPSHVPYDENIAADIQAALSRVGGIDLDKVFVEVNGGKVTLLGRVSTWDAYSKAFTATKFARGVVEIQNNLKIDK